jgi:hypothetical protein
MISLTTDELIRLATGLMSQPVCQDRINRLSALHRSLAQEVARAVGCEVLETTCVEGVIRTSIAARPGRTLPDEVLAILPRKSA